MQGQSYHWTFARGLVEKSPFKEDLSNFMQRIGNDLAVSCFLFGIFFIGDIADRFFDICIAIRKKKGKGR